jgi:hypothetical protein
MCPPLVMFDGMMVGTHRFIIVLTFLFARDAMLRPTLHMKELLWEVKWINTLKKMIFGLA